MKRCTQTAATLLCALVLAFGWVTTARAQGVTTSALAGRVTNEQGEPVRGATVVATNTRTGANYRAVTRGDGRYQLQGLQPGGPYRVQVSGIGQATQTRNGLQLALSQTEELNFSLSAQALALEGITATAQREGDVISAGRTGASTVISDSAISRLPTITRDFTDFTRLVPQISTGNGSSAGGRNNRFNNIQIDGAVNNDIFGLAASGTPGGQAGTKPITLEAIQEFQVVLAPFDVRQGGFTGAGINAVTKSGTNRFMGSAAYFTRNEGLVGNYRFTQADTAARSTDFGDFGQTEGAFSFGGPLVRDRAFFFLAGELSRRESPNSNFIVRGANGFETRGTLSIPGARVDSVASILQSRYGYNPGSFGEINTRRESDNLFGRLDFNLGESNRLTVRHNYVNAFDDNFSRSDAGFSLGGAGYVFNSTTNATVGQLNSTLGNQFFNELRVGYTTVRDNREVASPLFPRVQVDVRGCAGSNCSVIAGAENFSVQNSLDQDVLEVTNDLSFARGIHNITIGTHNEFFRFNNLFVRNPAGFYRFAAIDSLIAGRPSEYQFTFFNEATPGAKKTAEFPVQQYAVYAQDKLNLGDRFTLTAGLRYDLTRFTQSPGRNPRFEQVFDSIYGARQLGDFTRRTDNIPEHTGVLSPRVGFNWDVLGDQSTQLRGGVGVFSGRTPYVYVSNVYGNTGLDYTRFTCTPSSTVRVPNFVADPALQPRGCLNAAGQPVAPNALPNEINTIDPDFKLPRVSRFSFAVDRQLAMGFVGTLEGLWTQALSDPVYRDLTVGAATDTIREGRTVYSRITGPGFGNVYDVFNTDKNRSYNLTVQLQRPFTDGWEASIAYTRSKSEDVNSLTSSQAASNFRFNPVIDNPNSPKLRPSNFDVPDRIVSAVTRQFNLVRRSGAATDFSVIYVGESGTPFSYTYTGDINNDGSNANDMIYVPRDRSEVRFEPVGSNNPITPEQSFANLNNFIERVDCLREARGRVLERNACRQPWSNRFDIRVAQTVPTLRKQGAQITLDILNFGNLLNEEWGRSQFISNQNEVLLVRSGTSVAGPATGQTVLLRSFAPKRDVFRVADLGSRYQIQLGARYSF
ncbi:MAG TPA: TonB-dependent receptor [Longimicrobium sp.]|nr:TonB-dependent receptor [Longimicrobium sp.]